MMGSQILQRVGSGQQRRAWRLVGLSGAALGLALLGACAAGCQRQGVPPLSD
jgi:hypothetical protein